MTDYIFRNRRKIMIKEHKTGESQIELPNDFNSLAFESSSQTFYFLTKSEFDELHVYDR